MQIHRHRLQRYSLSGPGVEARNLQFDPSAHDASDANGWSCHSEPLCSWETPLGCPQSAGQPSQSLLPFSPKSLLKFLRLYTEKLGERGDLFTPWQQDSSLSKKNLLRDAFIFQGLAFLCLFATLRACGRSLADGIQDREGEHFRATANWTSASNEDRMRIESSSHRENRIWFTYLSRTLPFVTVMIMTHETHEPAQALSTVFINSLKTYLHMNKYINKQVQKHSQRLHLQMVARQSSSAGLWFSTCF